MAAGASAGFITAFLQTRLGVPSILAGIVTNTGLYTVNLMAMGWTSNANILKQSTIFTLFKATGIGGSWYELIVSAAITVAAGLIIVWFLGTRLGLSIRATGDNRDMVRASSVNPTFTITVGLCISSALTALSGALLAQYQKSCDINFGTGQVTIALASLMIGETLVRRGSIFKRTIGVILGSCLYRLIVAIAMKFNMPAEFLKLASALIVTAAIVIPYIKDKAAFYRRRMSRGNLAGK